MKQEFQEAMQPGVKYQGYGIINAFREFQFIPTQKGANEGRMKIVKQGENWSVHSTRDNIIIHLKIPRMAKPIERITEFLKVQQQVMDILKEYDLSKETDKKSKKK